MTWLEHTKFYFHISAVSKELHHRITFASRRDVDYRKGVGQKRSSGCVNVIFLIDSLLGVSCHYCSEKNYCEQFHHICMRSVALSKHLSGNWINFPLFLPHHRGRGIKVKTAFPCDYYTFFTLDFLSRTVLISVGYLVSRQK